MTWRKNVRLLVFFSAALALPAGGCGANGTLSREKISAGEKALNEAKISNASLNAPAELKTAEDKLAGARDALAKEDYEKAIDLSEQAQVDADYARTKATTAKAKKTAEEMRKNIQALRQEIERLSKQ
jgi:nitric oxide reductase activation protein